MSVEQIERQIESLSGEELAQFTTWFDQFLGRMDQAGGQEELDTEEQAELLRRRDELLAHPELAQPMDDQYFENLHRELADARARKASKR